MPKHKTISEKEFIEFSSKKEDLCFDRKGAKIQPKDLQKTIVAFANSEGGNICVGIEDSGLSSGIKNMSGFDANLKDGVFAIAPPILNLEYEFLEYLGEYFLLIQIPKSERVHSTTQSGVYVRVGACNKKLNQEEIQMLKYKKGEVTFEEESKNIDLVALTKSEYLKGYLKQQQIKATPEDFLACNGYIYIMVNQKYRR